MRVATTSVPAYGRALRPLWHLADDARFLNHGSFGACPKPVLAEQARLRERMELEPMRFFLRDLEPLVDEARRELAGFLGAEEDALAFVPNATSSVSTRSPVSIRTWRGLPPR